MRDKVIEIIRTMRGQAAIDNVMGEERCSFYLNDYANQLAEAIGYMKDNDEDAGMNEYREPLAEAEMTEEK
jgi:hypothetical protein